MTLKLINYISVTVYHYKSGNESILYCSYDNKSVCYSKYDHGG